MKNKRFLLFSLTSLFVTFLHLLIIPTASSKELSASSCPINLGFDISNQMNEQDCKRYTHSSNNSFYYKSRWKWNDYLSYGEATYYPLKSGFYWLKVHQLNKDNIKDWHELRNVRPSKVKDLSCSGHTCFTFADPSGDGNCMVYQRDVNKGNKLSEVTGATSNLYGYNCDTGKPSLFTTEEADKFLGNLDAK